MSIVTRRSSMTLFSDASDHYSHRVRMVVAEKGVNVDIVDVSPGKKPEDLAEINPYNTLPTLLDRELVLFESTVIMEYLDERFPAPSAAARSIRWRGPRAVRSYTGSRRTGPGTSTCSCPEEAASRHWQRRAGS